jgi:hypothetical protein
MEETAMSELSPSDFAALGSKLEEAVDLATDKIDRRATDRKQPWSMDHKIPAGLLIAMVAQLVVAIWTVASYKAEMQGQIDLIKADSVVIHQGMVTDADALRDTIVSMRAQFDKLDTKLDRIIERQDRK